MKTRTILTSLGVLIILLISLDTYLLTSHHTHKKLTTAMPAGCVALQFVPGSSGACVRDVQTMANFIETNGLTECPFTGGAKLSINGTYDTATQKQVHSVQVWVNCYNHQEGSNQSLSVNGSVNTATWSALCSYAYKLPSQASSSVSPYRLASLSAGKNADCASLFDK